MLDKFNKLPDWISRGLDDLFPHNDSEDSDQSFAKRLELSSIEKKPLRVKLGIDPTGTDIHIGHSIPFRKLRAFQDAGHTAVLIIGDFTARIGDPTGKSKTRIQLSKDEVESNALNYLEQLGLGKILKTHYLISQLQVALKLDEIVSGLKIYSCQKL